MDSMLHFLRNLGTARLAMIGAVTLAAIAFFAWTITQLSAPRYQLLYADLEMSDSARVAAQLETAAVPYELRQNGAAIYVPSDQVLRMRVALAEQGLPSGGSIGYEIFDHSDTLGTTSFVQNVNLVRALEGELARTIRAIDTVKAARVHLVLPRRELFSRERQEPSASVLLQMQGAARLTQSQVSAVQHLIASAVSGLNPRKVSIVDGDGTLLTAGLDSDDGAAVMSAQAEERRRRLQSQMARTIEQLLEKTVGPGKVRAEVFADMDFDRINTSEEVFDPDGQVVRSTQAVEEKGSSRDANNELPVSVASNLPDANVNAGASGGSTSESRNEETVNYEISKKVVNHVRESGVINRLSVAVLVDGIYSPGAEGAKSYQPRSQQELDLLATLVRGTIGFDARRGDSVEVINMRFAEMDLPAADADTLFLGLTKDDLFHIAQYLVLAILAVLVLLFVVRPLIKRATQPLPALAAGSRPNRLPGQTQQPALTAPEHGGLPVPSIGASTEESGEGAIDVNRIEGRVRSSAARQVGEIVDRHPEEALHIIRGWLYAEE